MIYPTRLAVVAAAAGAPVALAVAAVAPARWPMALGWPLAVLLLCLVDAVRSGGRVQGAITLPDSAYVGETRDLDVSLRFSGRHRAPSLEIAIDAPPLIGLESDGRLAVPVRGGHASALVAAQMLRRGMARFEEMWVRWTGPLALTWRQQRIRLGTELPILPDIRPVHDHGARLFERHSLDGLLAQLERGEGTDFDTLVEFRPGMDRRSIDWKNSARHSKLLSKQYRSERNSQIVFAIDSGRSMCEPIAGLPRVDRAVSAMLLTAWVALKLGDRVALNAFDSRPRLASGLVSGGGAFAQIERVAAEIDYSGEETNYSFALTTLAGRLTRRSMIILFTEFADSVSAQFLLRSIRRLVQTHLVLVVVLRDEELEQIAQRAPERPDDVTRAVTAAALLKDRRLVITELQHRGVHVIEAEYDRVAERLVAGYVEFKRRNLL